MFAAEFEPAQFDNRRRAQRAPVLLDAGLGGGGLARTLCKVVDISTAGARLQTYSALKKGTSIWLTLPHVGQVAANVMWADDYTAGCQFDRPLTTEAFEAILAHNGGGR